MVSPATAVESVDLPTSSDAGVSIESPISLEEYLPPPEYARLYTTENINNHTVMSPPLVPAVFTLFGEDIDTEAPPFRSLTDSNIPQHYSNNSDWKTEVKKVNHSIVFNFIDLIEILTHSPESAERLEKVETLRTLYINLYHLVNEFRFCQSRDTLRLLVANQIEESKNASAALKKCITVTRAFLDDYYSVMANIDVTEEGPVMGSVMEDST